MTRSASPMGLRRWCATLFASTLLALASAGPLGPHPVETTTTAPPAVCMVGNSTYALGAAVPAGVCERCSCTAGGVTCEREACQPRPGCKAVHRPDHCCPTYQCECEQEGRVYSNGEKLVDPQDPCRVCYCQGGEVVCRRIACFLRDDCRPRLVPGRCCPEYDNCPLRGVTAIPGVAPSNVLPLDTTTAAPSPPPEKVKQEITIKEITPVSEIPVITDVKIKEIPPPPSVEVIEYPSSKAPLIPREATSERTFSEEPPAAGDHYPSPSSVHVFTASQEPTSSTRTNEDSAPSKISLSKQDSINSDIYPSSASSSIQTTLSQPSTTIITNKPQVIEEDDQTIFEHNPAFPPLPDDLSVLSNHEDEIMPEQPMDTEHSESSTHPEPSTTTTTTTTTTTSTTSAPPPTTTIASTPPSTTVTTTTTTPPLTEASTTTEKIITTNPTTVGSETGTTLNHVTTTSEEIQAKKVSQLLNLRSAIPTEILSLPSSVPEEITGEVDKDEVTSTKSDVTTTAQAPSTTVSSTAAPPHSPSTSKPTKVTTLATSTSPSAPTTAAQQETITLLHLTTRKSPVSVASSVVTHSATSASTAASDQSTEKEIATTHGITTVYTTKSSDVTTKTEFSSLPIETSDQNPPSSVSGAADSTDKERTSTSEPLTAPTSIKMIVTEAEPITVSRSSNTDQSGNDNYETTEFILTSFGSSETTTDPVELLKISSDADKNAAIIDPGHKNKINVLTDLINLVGDVASISNNSEADHPHPSVVPIIPDSEELIPVNAGYKSNKNKFNVNSITEIPLKTKSPSAPGRQKVIEIEEDTTEQLTDLPPPGDRVEPTTRRPIIDHVTDDGPTPTATDKDIEIITKSYVPTINRRPTKVVLKEEGLDPPGEAR